jgi:hypothetical protein
LVLSHGIERRHGGGQRNDKCYAFHVSFVGCFVSARPSVQALSRLLSETGHIGSRFPD